MEFADLGKHCHYCNFQDYLPFHCDKCKNYYCKEHWKSHNCQTPKQEFKSIKCPLCNKKFLLEKKEDENEYIENHFTKDCSYFKEKCKYHKCKEYKFLNLCNKCNKKYCISHRHHTCN